MELDNFKKDLRKNVNIFLLASLLLASLVFIVSVLITPKYSSDISVLVIQKQPEDKVDAFSAAKSAEYLSDIFSKIIYMDSFIDDVLQTPGITNTYSSDKEERKKEWEKQVDVRKINNTGIIEITVLDPSKKEAEKLVRAISSNLSANNKKYHGGGEKVSVNTIDGPITSQMPATPNVFLNTLIGFIVGMIGSIGYLYFFGKNKRSYLG